ncbi:BrnA antitoxin family protein [Sphingomonas adhaesiva]|uniref:BrnA antitoxin family protein n=1 Tax=Sphingomonas adhaesiva TaxID=28212 RepID=UPI002FF5CA9B
MTKGYTQADMDAVSDNPELTADDIASAVPFVDAFPDLAAKMRATRGPQKKPTKQPITLRLDGDILDRFRATGPGWQVRINDALRKVAP